MLTKGHHWNGNNLSRKCTQTGAEGIIKKIALVARTSTRMMAQLSTRRRIPPSVIQGSAHICIGMINSGCVRGFPQGVSVCSESPPNL